MEFNSGFKGLTVLQLLQTGLWKKKWRSAFVQYRKLSTRTHQKRRGLLCSVCTL